MNSFREYPDAQPRDSSLISPSERFYSFSRPKLFKGSTFSCLSELRIPRCAGVSQLREITMSRFSLPSCSNPCVCRTNGRSSFQIVQKGAFVVRPARFTGQMWIRARRTRCMPDNIGERAFLDVLKLYKGCILVGWTVGGIPWCIPAYI